MTRKDFVAIATALHDAKPEQSTAEYKAWKAWERIVDEMSTILRGTNPRFDKGRFINACYGTKNGAR